MYPAGRKGSLVGSLPLTNRLFNGLAVVEAALTGAGAAVAVVASGTGVTSVVGVGAGLAAAGAAVGAGIFCAKADETTDETMVAVKPASTLAGRLRRSMLGVTVLREVVLMVMEVKGSGLSHGRKVHAQRQCYLLKPPKDGVSCVVVAGVEDGVDAGVIVAGVEVSVEVVVTDPGAVGANVAGTGAVLSTGDVDEGAWSGPGPFGSSGLFSMVVPCSILLPFKSCVRR